MNTPFKSMIIDDEPLARVRLQKLISDYQTEFEIVGEAENGKEAVEKIRLLKPDLLFLDIQMPGLDGFEVLKQLDYQPKVIFCTAFDEYALQAFNAYCIDYLVKPITKERFAKTVEKLGQFNGSSSEMNLQKLIQQLPNFSKKAEATTLPVKVGDRVIFVRLDEVSYFKADEKYVSVVTKHSKSYILDTSLKQIEEKLPASFIRVHKAYLVNKNLVKEIRKHFNNRFIFILDDYDQSKITSGRSYYQSVREFSEI
ncbi:MAG: LytR/AlgR family response regulator transcription factor [Draconibacterium sp.]